MIEINIYKDKDNNYLGYVINGHANYAEKGKDIVCAGVSIIGQAILLGLNKLDIGLSKGTCDGVLEVNTHTKDIDMQDKVNLLMSILEEVLNDIALQYPKNVSVEIISQSI